MHIFVGLGNPGKEFEKTRHNVGFMAIDNFAEKYNFPEFKLNKKSNALISEKDGILLAKPQTFMNESGKSVKELIKNKTIENLIVIHDDVDLPIGKIKISKNAGSAGHKGIESIIQNIGNEGLTRIRMGVGLENKVEAVKIVLKKFSIEEQKIIDGAINKTVDALNLFLKEGLDKAMNKYN